MGASIDADDSDKIKFKKTLTDDGADNAGAAVDFLSTARGIAKPPGVSKAPWCFLCKAIESHVTGHKSDNEILRIKYLDNIAKQDH